MDGQIKKLYKQGSRYMLGSWIPRAFDHGDTELMFFACDKDGQVNDFTDLFVERGCQPEEGFAKAVLRLGLTFVRDL